MREAGQIVRLIPSDDHHTQPDCNRFHSVGVGHRVELARIGEEWSKC